MPPPDNRYDVVVPVRFRDAEDFMVQYAESISMGGIFIATQNAPPIGTQLKLSLELPGSQTAVPVRAEVVAVAPHGCQASFVELDPATAHVLQNYVQGLQQQSRGRVVVVDDDTAIIDYLTTFLRRSQFTVIACSAPSEALQVLGREQVDVVLSDLYMPEMSGPQTRDVLLATRPDLQEIPWILMTSSEDPGHEQRADQLGFYSFLKKPLDREVLVQTLIDALARKPKMPKAAPQDALARLGIKDGRIDFRFMKLCNAVTGQPIESASVTPVGPDVVALSEPAHLSRLPHIHIEGMPDQIAFEAQVVRSYHARVEWLGRGKALLARFGVPATVSEAGFCVVGTVLVGRETIAFSVRDQHTLAIEAIDGQPFADSNNPSDALVDLTGVANGADLQRAVLTQTARLEAGPVPAQPAPVSHTPTGDHFGSMDDDSSSAVEPGPMRLLEQAELDAVTDAAGDGNFDESFFENVNPPEAFSLMCSICGDSYELRTGSEDSAAYVACPACR